MLRVISFAAAALVSTSAFAAEPATATASSSEAPAQERQAVAPAEEPLPVGKGLRAFIDPITGQLRQPTAEETAASAATSRVARNKSIEGLEVEYRKDGSKFVDLQGRFMHSLRVTRNADGTSSFTCTDRDPHTHPQSGQPSASVAPATK